MVAKLVKEHGIVPLLTLGFSVSSTIILALVAFIGARAIAQIDTNRINISTNDKNIAVLEQAAKWQDYRIQDNTERICEIERRRL